MVNQWELRIGSQNHRIETTHCRWSENEVGYNSRFENEFGFWIDTEFADAWNLADWNSVVRRHAGGTQACTQVPLWWRLQWNRAGKFYLQDFFGCKKRERTLFHVFTNWHTYKTICFLLVPGLGLSVPWSRVGMVINPGIPHELGATINIQ